MKFKRLKINNFLAIGEVELELDNLGLVLIQGINDDEPSASSNGAGKCLSGSTLIQDARTGRTLPVSKWHEEFISGNEMFVHGMDEHLKLFPTKVIDVVRNGKKKMLRIEMMNGRCEIVSESHPVLTANGLSLAKELIVGDYVAAPRCLRVSQGDNRTSPMTTEEVIVLAGFMADGSLTRQGYGFTKGDPEVIDLMDRSLRNAYHLKLSKHGTKNNCQWSINAVVDRESGGRRCLFDEMLSLCKSLSVKIPVKNNLAKIMAGERGVSSEVLEKLFEMTSNHRFLEISQQLYPMRALRQKYQIYGVHNTLSKNKEMPEIVFSLPDEQLKTFVKMFWACDGYVSKIRKNGGIDVSVTLASESLVDSMSRILLRLGVQTRKRHRVIRGKFDAWEIASVGRESLVAMCKLLSDMPNKNKRDRALAILNMLELQPQNDNLDIIPPDVLAPLVASAKKRTGLPMVAKEAGLNYSFSQLKKNGRGRDKVFLYSKYFDDDALRDVAESDIAWWKIKSISQAGEEETYDIEIDTENHLYALAGFITHNSATSEALSWVLFGKTARGLSADAVVNRVVGKNTAVELEVEDAGQTYFIRRYRKHDVEHNRLTLHQVLADGSEQDITKGTDKLTQEDIEALLGCSYEVFCVAVYAGQERFPDLPGLTDKALKVLIEEAAGVERLQRAYEIARERLSQIKTQYELRDLEWSRLHDQLQLHQRRQADLRQQMSDWLQQQQAQRLQWQQEAVQKRQEADRLQATIQPNQLAQLQAALQSVQSRLSAATNPTQDRQLEAAVQQAAVYLGAAQQHEDLTRHQLDQARHELQHLDQRVGSTCRECGKVYQTEDLDQARVAIHQKIHQLQNTLEQAQQTVAERASIHSKASQDLQAYRDALPDVSKLVELQQRVQDRLSKFQLTQQAIERLVSDSERLERQAMSDTPNPLQTALEGLQRDLQQVSQELQQVEQHRQQLEQDLLLTKDAVDVFAPAGVRAQILDTVTPFLNDRTAGYLGLLSDGNILATWQTLTRNAKGELKEKFSIDVTSMTGGLDFRSLSGGEKRKVRLATALALADLVAARAIKPIDLFFCDEIDDAVDGSGLERLMAVLEQKAQERGTLIIISHNDLANYIRSTITIRKTNGLARLE